MLRSKAYAAAAAVFIGLSAQASATTIDITYTGIVTDGSSSFGAVSLNGDPFTLVYTFDTSLAAPGNYINSGSSSQLSGSGFNLFGANTYVGFASISFIGLINPSVCNTVGCSTSENDTASIGSIYSQSVIVVLKQWQRQPSVQTQLFANPAIPGDITQNFSLIGSDIGTGSFVCFFTPASQAACSGAGGASGTLQLEIYFSSSNAYSRDSSTFGHGARRDKFS